MTYKQMSNDSKHGICFPTLLKALFGCRDIIILGNGRIKWRQRPDLTYQLTGIESINSNTIQSGGSMGLRPLGPKEIDGLLVPQCWPFDYWPSGYW